MLAIQRYVCYITLDCGDHDSKFKLASVILLYESLVSSTKETLFLLANSASFCL